MDFYKFFIFRLPDKDKSINTFSLVSCSWISIFVQVMNYIITKRLRKRFTSFFLEDAVLDSTNTYYNGETFDTLIT